MAIISVRQCLFARLRRVHNGALFVAAGSDALAGSIFGKGDTFSAQAIYSLPARCHASRLPRAIRGTISRLQSCPRRDAVARGGDESQRAEIIPVSSSHRRGPLSDDPPSAEEGNRDWF